MGSVVHFPLNLMMCGRGGVRWRRRERGRWEGRGEGGRGEGERRVQVEVVQAVGGPSQELQHHSAHLAQWAPRAEAGETTQQGQATSQQECVYNSAVMLL